MRRATAFRGDRIVLSLLMTWLAFTAMAAETSEHDRQIARVLQALDFGGDAKEMFSGAELDAQTAQALSAIPDRRFVEIAVPLFRSVVSAEEAKALADFYETDTMRTMLAEQKRTGAGAPVAKTQEQAAAVNTFMKDNAAALSRVQQALQRQEFSEAFAAAILRELEKAP